MLVYYKGEDFRGQYKKGTYKEVKSGGQGSRKLLYTIFTLIVLSSTYFILKSYDVIQADDSSPDAGEGDDIQEIANEDEASVDPPYTSHGSASSSITLYQLLLDHDLSIGWGRVSEGVMLECEIESLLELAKKCSLILVEQEMECEKAYNVTGDNIYYKLHDTAYVSLVGDSGTYLWSREYVHELDDWNENVFLLYKIPITKLEFSEAKWSGYERLEITSGTCEKPSDPVSGPYWAVTLRVRNSGSNVAIITHTFVNDVPVSAYGVSRPVDKMIASEPAQNLAVRPGEIKNVKIFIDCDYGRLTTGTTINLRLHCDSGMDYIKLIKLV